MTERHPQHPCSLRPVLLSLLVVVILVPSRGRTSGRGDGPLPATLAASFRPPPEFAGEYGTYRSPLKFADGREVRTPAEWLDRRKEILRIWHDLMSPWPALLEAPGLQVLSEERRENFLQQRVRVGIVPGRQIEGYFLVPEGKGRLPAALVVYYDPETGIGRGRGELRDFALQLARRGFVALSIGLPNQIYYPSETDVQLQPLSCLAYVAANCHTALARHPRVDAARIGVVGHSYGGKWALFASCLYERFACGVWSDPGIVFDERRGNVNYWEPWYLGWEAGTKRKPGIPKPDNPRTGAYRKMIEAGRDLHELHALMAPRPFLVSGGAEDPPERWKALNHSVAINRLLGHSDRVAMTNRPTHTPTAESNEQIYAFFEYFLGARR